VVAALDGSAFCRDRDDINQWLRNRRKTALSIFSFPPTTHPIPFHPPSPATRIAARGGGRTPSPQVTRAAHAAASWHQTTTNHHRCRPRGAAHPRHWRRGPGHRRRHRHPLTHRPRCLGGAPGPGFPHGPRACRRGRAPGSRGRGRGGRHHRPQTMETGDQSAVASAAAPRFPRPGQSQGNGGGPGHGHDLGFRHPCLRHRRRQRRHRGRRHRCQHHHCLPPHLQLIVQTRARSTGNKAG
jgi:hypothetical protein